MQMGGTSIVSLTVWSHMVLPHSEGGCGVTCNNVTTDDPFYTSSSRFVNWLVLSPRTVRSRGCLEKVFF